MSKVRNVSRLATKEAVAMLNKLRLDMMKLKAGTVYHAEATTTVSTADATADGYATSSVALVNSCVSAYHVHCASVCNATTGLGAHLAADTTNLVTSPVATDLDSAITRANELKADYNAHRASTVFHPNADTTNTVSASDATNEATLVTLVNQIKARLNSHITGSFTSEAIELVSA